VPWQAVSALALVVVAMLISAWAHRAGERGDTWEAIGAVMVVTPTSDVPDRLPEDWPIAFGDRVGPYRELPCGGHGLAGDVREGTAVRFYDDQGDEVASVALPAGRAVGGSGVNGSGPDSIMCRFEFDVHDIPLDSHHPRFQVQLGHRTHMDLPQEPTVAAGGNGYMLVDLWVDGRQVSFESPAIH
jgi:hypothetical protein